MKYLISLLLSIVFATNALAQQYDRPTERPADYKETRRIKYLYEDEFNIVVFFDNGKAAMTNSFFLCTENLSRLYTIATPYTYEVVPMGGETYMTYTRAEDKYSTGLSLAKYNWYIKDFESVRPMSDCADRASEKRPDGFGGY